MSNLENYKGAFFVSILIILVLGFFTIKFYLEIDSDNSFVRDGDKISFYPTTDYKINVLLDSNEVLQEWVGMNLAGKQYVTNRFENNQLKEFYIVDIINEIDFSMYNKEGNPYLIRLKQGVNKEYYLHFRDDELSAVSTHLGGQEVTVLHFKENSTLDSLIIHNWPERNKSTKVVMTEQDNQPIDYSIVSK